MKKLLQSISTITLLSCILSGASHAHIGDLMYVRGDVLWSKFNDVSTRDQNLGLCSHNNPTHTIVPKGGKYSHKYNFGGVVGLGYIVNNKLRAEVVYNRVYTDKFKYSNLPSLSFSKIKVDINAFFGRVAYDILDRGAVQIFIGGGLGIANVRHTVTGAKTYYIQTACIDNGKQFLYGFKSKNKNNIAYSLTFGATTKITDDFRIETAYSFVNYGQTSRIVGGSGEKIALRSHNLSLGLRYDLM